MKVINKKFLIMLFMILLTGALVSCEDKVETSVTIGVIGIDQKLTINDSYGLEKSPMEKLIHSYELIGHDEEGKEFFNKTVLESNPTLEEIDLNNDELLDYKYTFKLSENLKWSDGKKLDAYDYIEPLYMLILDDWCDETNHVFGGAQYKIVGYNEYIEQSTLYSEETINPLLGVELIDDYSFSITIDSSVAFMDVISHFNLNPFPMHEILSKDSTSVLELFEKSKTLKVSDLDKCKDNKYSFTTDVVSGPYKITSLEEKEATLIKNKYFKGDAKGQVPSIDSIKLKVMGSEIFDANINSNIEYDIATYQVDHISLKNLREHNYNISIHNKLESSYVLQFDTNFGATRERYVRQAISHLYDLNKVARQLQGIYYEINYSAYIKSSGVYKDNIYELESKLKNRYEYSISKANELLDASFYKYTSDGVTKWEPGIENEPYRYNYNGEKLVISYMTTNAFGDKYNLEAKETFIKAGICYEYDEVEFSEYIDYNYLFKETNQERKYNIIPSSISTNNYVNTFTAQFHSKGENNNLEIDEYKLDEAIEKMQNAKNIYEYNTAWVEFQLKLNELALFIPKYSSVIFDAAKSTIKGFNTTAHYDWAEAICGISVEKE